MSLSIYNIIPNVWMCAIFVLIYNNSQLRFSQVLTEILNAIYFNLQIYSFLHTIHSMWWAKVTIKITVYSISLPLSFPLSPSLSTWLSVCLSLSFSVYLSLYFFRQNIRFFFNWNKCIKMPWNGCFHINLYI